VTVSGLELNICLVPWSVDVRSESLELGEEVLCPGELEASGEDVLMMVVVPRELKELVSSTDTDLVGDITSEDLLMKAVVSACVNV
jgi:hypothetical protein